MSYGAKYAKAYYKAGIYAGRILNGAKPSDLPIERPEAFEFLIDLKTAKTLGLTIPSGVLTIADEVIRHSFLNIRYWPKADIPSCTAHMSAFTEPNIRRLVNLPEPQVEAGPLGRERDAVEINGIAHIRIRRRQFSRSREFYRWLLPFLGLKPR